jgi:hypothetical protein
MISAFQCQELGFGLQISKEGMARVIMSRNDQVYKDKAAAKAKCGDTEKKHVPIRHFLFLLDHSCGQDRQREDGLNIEQMNKAFGGNQPKMRKTKIKEAK